MVVVFRNPIFDRRTSWSEREAALRHIQKIATIVEIPSPIRACRDPRDDKFWRSRCMAAPI
jgi:hypothetical protein